MLRATSAWLRAHHAGVLVDAAAALWKARAETAVAVAGLVGWLLITAAVAELTSALAWHFSIGALLLLLCGWRFLWRLFSDGLYDLSRERKP